MSFCPPAGLGLVFCLVACSSSLDPLVSTVEQSRYLADLKTIAQPRPPGSAHWQTVQDLCFDRLQSLGYQTERQDYGGGVNVVGRRPGVGRTNEQVVVSAHYDHIAGCAGADDNASGVAGLLEVARVLASGDRSYARTLVIGCWDEEERGLVGSSAFAQAAAGAGETIVIAYDFEMIGYASSAANSQEVPAGMALFFPAQAAQLEENDNRGDFIALIHDSPTAGNAFANAARAVGLPLIDIPLTAQQKNNPLVGDLFRSDHASFWRAGYPAMMITDTANFRYSGYHCRDGEDTVDRLDHGFATKVIKATVGSVLALVEG